MQLYHVLFNIFLVARNDFLEIETQREYSADMLWASVIASPSKTSGASDKYQGDSFLDDLINAIETSLNNVKVMAIYNVLSTWNSIIITAFDHFIMNPSDLKTNDIRRLLSIERNELKQTIFVYEEFLQLLVDSRLPKTINYSQLKNSPESTGIYSLTYLLTHLLTYLLTCAADPDELSLDGYLLNMIVDIISWLKRILMGIRGINYKKEEGYVGITTISDASINNVIKLANKNIRLNTISELTNEKKCKLYMDDLLLISKIVFNSSNVTSSLLDWYDEWLEVKTDWNDVVVTKKMKVDNDTNGGDSKRNTSHRCRFINAIYMLEHSGLIKIKSGNTVKRNLFVWSKEFNNE